MLRRGGAVLCALVSSAEGARRGRLSHGKVEVRLVLLVQDVLHSAPIRHPSVCVVLAWWSNGWLFLVVNVVLGGRRYLKYLDLYRQGPMSRYLGQQVVVSRPCYLDVCQVRVAEVHAGIFRAMLRWSF